MKIISSKVDYPNMTCEEIVASGISLSGDALELFMHNAKESDADELTELKESVHEALSTIMLAVSELEGEL